MTAGYLRAHHANKLAALLEDHMTRSRSVVAGYIVLGLLALLDALGFLLAAGDAKNAPPVAVNAVGTVLGVATLVALVAVLRSRGRDARTARPAVVTVIVSRTLSAVLGVQVFAADVPAAIKLVVAATMILTVAGILLIRRDAANPDSRGAPAMAKR
jgi:O-antigen/teichoic acid export membrane protein